MFSDTIGDRPMDVTLIKLNVDESVLKPPKVTMVRAVPLHWQIVGERILTDLLQTGIVKRVTDSVPFVSPSFFIKKGDGSGDPRFVIYYKGTLNPSLIRVPHPLPSPMQVWARIMRRNCSWTAASSLGWPTYSSRSVWRGRLQ